MRSSFGGQIDDVRAYSSSELIWDLLVLFFSDLEAALILWALGLLFSSGRFRQSDEGLLQRLETKTLEKVTTQQAK